MGHATVAAPLQYPCRGALAVCVAQPWLRVRREERGWAFASSDLGGPRRSAGCVGLDAASKHLRGQQPAGLCRPRRSPTG